MASVVSLNSVCEYRSIRHSSIEVWNDPCGLRAHDALAICRFRTFSQAYIMITVPTDETEICHDTTVVSVPWLCTSPLRPTVMLRLWLRLSPAMMACRRKALHCSYPAGHCRAALDGHALI